MPLTREQAQAAAAAASAERDAVQANLLDLDGSFGKRLLAGAALTGGSRDQWAAASAGLATLWDSFTAYSAVIDRAAEILAKPGRIPLARLDEVTAMLTGPSVLLARAVKPLGQRELTAGGQVRLSLRQIVREMRTSFTSVAATFTAAETVWNEISDGIRQVTADIDAAKRQLPGRPEDELGDTLPLAETNLRQLRDQLNSDPLSFWRGGRVDSASLEQLRRQAAAGAAQVLELASVRADADQRLAEVTGAVGATRQAWQDATAARERAASRISVSENNPMPDLTDLINRLASLPALKAAGRWTRLAAEINVVSRQAAELTRQCKEAERAAADLIGRRNELRGLLGAYRAKAGGLGAAENAELDQRYRQAKDLLWTAPCDLTAASAAVTGYQQAILHLRRSGDRQ